MEHLSRRAALTGLVVGMTFRGNVSFATTVNQKSKRFVVIVLRGALDGLTAVPPYGDGDYASLRGNLALQAPGISEVSMLRLNERFGLHPAMVEAHKMFLNREMSIVHAMASPYRERSHFDAQNLLELGTTHTTGADGWLNRTLGAMGAESWKGLAVGSTVPLILQGQAPVSNWKPEQNQPAGNSLILSVAKTYETTDPALARALNEGLQTSSMIDTAIDSKGRRIGSGFATLANATGKILASDTGPNIAVLDLGGWDTHVGQGTDKGRMAGPLSDLSRGLEGLKIGLGDKWTQTVVIAVTEFGRTAHPNGTNGTDHGTATAGFIAGGAVNGGYVLADWPGLSQTALFEGRDLAPTTDMRSMLKAVLSDHLKITLKTIEDKVFPDSFKAKPIKGLVNV